MVVYTTFYRGKGGNFHTTLKHKPYIMIITVEYLILSVRHTKVPKEWLPVTPWCLFQSVA